ncbi:membrane protein insertion efficiency factor YidD [Plastoroseomonas hellenica]|uniref:membrane protein insertion efficiency factor YidD n=1 Tax=Plastoroseomonas hellenica TaxID=2687306 RepID=UPI001BA7FE1B|nr:membrane protein insertion efficiency factor YidD [Plastoroseomonas hellenica]MBR0644618.1 membrane protein insertion efficiency factor YidD [Plastoroseomonas hellenica]
MTIAHDIDGAAALALKGCVHTYRYTLRGVIGSHCRFHPHCSDYALEALSAHGALRGSLLTARRILRCNPWHPGGYDPVPSTPTPKG